ncbi:hypothetical protein [Peribacillus butanolivorans]
MILKDLQVLRESINISQQLDRKIILMQKVIYDTQFLKGAKRA